MVRTFVITIPPHSTDIFLDNLSSLEALITALDNLDNLCETIEDEFLESLKKDEFEKWDEKR